MNAESDLGSGRSSQMNLPQTTRSWRKTHQVGEIFNPGTSLTKSRWTDHRFKWTSVFIAFIIFTVGLVLCLGLTTEVRADSPIYVRPGGHDALCHGTVNVDYSADIAPACAVQTIQTGVISVTAGGAVNVTAGIYPELITITKSLTLTGESGVVIHPAENIPEPDDAHRGSIVWVQAPNVILRDLTIDGDNPTIGGGISAYGADINAFRGIYMHDPCFDRLRVERVTLHNLARGINLYCGQDHVIHHNTLYHLGGPSDGQHGFGILLMNNTSAQITHNHVMTATLSGIFMQNNASANDTLISGNAITNVGVGLGWNGLSGGAHAVVEHNRVDDVNWGMQVTSINNGDIHIQHNAFTLTSSSAIGYYTCHTAPDTTYILSNTITGGNFGIWLKDDDPAFGPGIAYLAVAGNELRNINYGLVVDSKKIDYEVSLQATRNTFVNHPKTAIYLRGSAPISTIIGGAPGEGNQFLNNATHISVTLPHTTPDILALYNDWESDDLNEIEATIHHQADDAALAEVRYYTLTATAQAKSVLADGNHTGMVTGTLSGLLSPAGNTIAFTTSLGIVNPPTNTTTPDTATTQVASPAAGVAIITATAGYRSATATLTFIPDVVDHFAFGQVEDQIAGRAFTVTITAEAENGDVVTNYTGSADLADATGALTPSMAGPFTDGAWTGPISITQAMTANVLTATHPVDPGITGQSNAFTVTHHTAVTLTLDPPTAIITAGDQIAYTVIATDTYGNRWDVSAAAAYTITPGAGGAWDANAYTAEIAGAWTVAAAYQGRVATAALTVTADGSAPATLFLPLVTRNYVQAPDLIITHLVATPNNITLTIKNQGNAPVPDPFWIDAYINPHTVPTEVNQTWELLASQGLVWGIERSSLSELAPGGTLTLTVGDMYYWEIYSEITWPLPEGAIIYAQVDSVNTETDYGAVQESHEIINGTYNNIIGPIYSTARAATSIHTPRDEPMHRGDSHLPGRP